MTVKDTLVRTREILIERGVNRDGWFIDGDQCKVCIMGGVYLAAGGRVQVEEYEDLEWSEDVQDYVRTSQEQIEIVGYDRREVEAAREEISQAISPMYGQRGYGQSIVRFNDTSTSDDEVIAVLDRAIASVE